MSRALQLHMHKFTYKISLRIWHPSMDPADISARLSLVPTFQWKAGQARQSPKGAPLKGFYKETYCSYAITSDQYSALSESLRALLTDLTPQKDFLHEVRSTGGRIECFIGWFSGSNSGEIFDHSLLSLFGELQIDLALDVYGQSEHKVEIIAQEDE